MLQSRPLRFRLCRQMRTSRLAFYLPASVFESGWMNYRLFYTQVADQIASTIWEADAVERERELLETAEAERSQIRELFLNAPAGILVTTGPEHHVTLANRQYVS